nr:hypothetical protein [Tellurirhabdus bombi]
MALHTQGLPVGLIPGVSTFVDRHNMVGDSLTSARRYVGKNPFLQAVSTKRVIPSELSRQALPFLRGVDMPIRGGSALVGLRGGLAPEDFSQGRLILLTVGMRR